MWLTLLIASILLFINILSSIVMAITENNGFWLIVLWLKLLSTGKNDKTKYPFIFFLMLFLDGIWEEVSVHKSLFFNGFVQGTRLCFEVHVHFPSRLQKVLVIGSAYASFDPNPSILDVELEFALRIVDIFDYKSIRMQFKYWIQIMKYQELIAHLFQFATHTVCTTHPHP